MFFTSDRQRKAVFSQLARMGSGSFSCVKFAEKPEAVEKPKTNVKMLEDYEYEQMKKRGQIGVSFVTRPDETLNTYKGEVVMHYNPVGAPYVTDTAIHEVSKIHPPLRGGSRAPLVLKEEKFCPGFGLYRGVGSRSGFNEEVCLDTNRFPSNATRIKNIRKLLAESEYLDKFPNASGVGFEDDVVDKGSVIKAVGDMSLERKEQIRKDAVREKKMDKKLKEAMGIPMVSQTVEIPSEGPIKESTAKIRDFVIESSEPIKDEVIKDISESVVKPVAEKPEVVIPNMEQPKVEIPKMEQPKVEIPLLKEEILMPAGGQYADVFRNPNLDWRYRTQKWDVI